MQLLTGGISVWSFWLERGQRSMSATALAVHLYTTRLHRLHSAGEIRLHISIKYNSCALLLYTAVLMSSLSQNGPASCQHPSEPRGWGEGILLVSPQQIFVP